MKAQDKHTLADKRSKDELAAKMSHDFQTPKAKEEDDFLDFVVLSYLATTGYKPSDDELEPTIN